MTDETYNGWANRETWAVALYINNDQGWQERTHETVRHVVLDSDTDPAAMTNRAGEAIRDDVEQITDPDEELMSVTDIVSFLKDVGSLYRVDWDEIGAAFVADVREQES